MDYLIEWELAGETEVVIEKPAQMLLYVPKIPHELTWD
jgi:hypothetical protein